MDGLTKNRPKGNAGMRIVALSDTHGQHDQVIVPEGDVLIFAGDFLRRGSRKEIPGFRQWLYDFDHEWKILVAGNHDWAFFNTPAEAQRILAHGTLRREGLVYLEDREFVIDGIKFYGSPWQPDFFDWAFNLPRGAVLDRKWRMIPADTDVLITHGPPQGILDWNFRDQRFGCEDLRRHVTNRVRPKVHIFGHAHAAHGYEHQYGIDFYNVAICDEDYIPVHNPTIIEVS